MRLPRDLPGDGLAQALEHLGYRMSRQIGSHLRSTTADPTEHRVTVPRHDALRFGTPSAILRDVAEHHGLSEDDLMDPLFQ